MDSLSGLSVDSPQFRHRAPRVQLSDDPDTATVQTVQEMCRQIHQAAQDALVQRDALDALRRFRDMGPAESCFWWCKHFLKFRHHGSMFEAWSPELGDPATKLQLLIAPDVLVRMERMEGDCAIYTMMLCAMLEALGLQWDIVTAAVDASQPTIFSHVWPRVMLDDGGHESLDASHGSYPGWHVPERDLHRVWVFDSMGSRVAGDGGARSRFQGLHAYRHGMRRGFGQTSGVDPSTGEAYGPDVTIPTDQYLQPGGTSYDLGPGYFGATPAGSMTAPAQNSAQWAAFATALAKGGLTLAEINSIQPGTVVGPNGQILRQNPGYAVGTPTIAGNLGVSTTTLMVGGVLLLAAVFMFSGRGR